MDEKSWTQRAGSFGEVAEDYERGRPQYPADAVEWLAGSSRRVVDLGAGTGKLTASLVGARREVVALEPQYAMVARLRAGVAGAHAVCAAAEALPVRDGWADTVVVGQAFHWFDRDRAVPEIARVLEPDGCLGLAWNVRDESVDWVARWSGLAGTDNSRATRSSLGLAPYFGRYETRTFRMVQTVDREMLVAAVRSRSHVAVLDAARRERVVEEVLRLCDTHPDLAGRDSYELPYVTEAFRAQKA